jgi:hypothetical protein
VLTPEQGEIIKSLYSRGLAAMVGVDIDHPLSIASSAAPRGLPGPAPAQTSAVTVDAVPAPSSDDGVPF